MSRHRAINLGTQTAYRLFETLADQTWPHRVGGWLGRPAQPRLLARLRAAPRILRLEGTNRCNARCRMCVTWRHRGPRGEMDWELYTRLVDEYAALPGRRKEVALFMNGEPLLDSLLVRRIRHAKTRGIPRVQISTNGSLLRGELARDLLDSGLDLLIVDLDAVRPETYSKVRQGLDFHEVKANVEAFLARKEARSLVRPWVVLRFIITPDNAPEVAEFRRRWRGRCNVLHTYAAHTWGAGDEASPRYRALRARFPGGVPCFRLFGELVVHHDGQVPLCCVDHRRTRVLGDLTRESLSAVWHGASLAEVRARHQAQALDDLPLCRGCEVPYDARSFPFWWSGMGPTRTVEDA